MNRKKLELLLATLVVALALCSCREEDKDPVAVVDPGPPFHPPLPQLRAAHRLADGSVLLLLERAQ